MPIKDFFCSLEGIVDSTTPNKMPEESSPGLEHNGKHGEKKLIYEKRKSNPA